MDIVYSIDDNFIPQAAALTASILKEKTTSGAEGSGRFCFHILSNGISEENQRTFEGFVRELGGEICFHDLGDFEGRLERLLGAKPETGRFVKAALGRIFAAEYLPEDVHRFLYLDADMIARKDIRGLWEIDLDPGRDREKERIPSKTGQSAGEGSPAYILAACGEPTIYEDLAVEQENRQESENGTAGVPGRKSKNGPADVPGPSAAEKAYFNTGLLYVDLDAWRKEEITKKCLRWYAEHNGKFDFADQDILNNVLAGRILSLSPRWNFQTNYHYQSYASLVKRAPWYGKQISGEDYESSRRDPSIVHYAGDERPWIRGNQNPYREDYRKALALTPWKETPEVTGRENYMRFYHVINVLSEKLPGFRSLVSKVYYHTKVKR